MTGTTTTPRASNDDQGDQAPRVLVYLASEAIRVRERLLAKLAEAGAEGIARGQLRKSFKSTERPVFDVVLGEMLADGEAEELAYQPARGPRRKLIRALDPEGDQAPRASIRVAVAELAAALSAGESDAELSHRVKETARPLFTEARDDKADIDAAKVAAISLACQRGHVSVGDLWDELGCVDYMPLIALGSLCHSGVLDRLEFVGKDGETCARYVLAANRPERLAAAKSERVREKLADLGVFGKPDALGVPFRARGADGRVRTLVWREAASVTGQEAAE
ncbi:hypothetical protein [Flexivirga sp.]|uniref:hypothetical protein n=1 Tax=Flexivirga sp. TaxID=1962927 RepID=UPI003F823897